VSTGENPAPSTPAPIGAVAVVNDAMVARAHDRVAETNDPTAHAVIVALREASRKMGRDRLADATIFVTREPCPMCVGALLACDVEALVFAATNIVDGAAGGAAFFKEFIVKTPVPAEAISRKLTRRGVVPGLPLSRYYTERTHELLSCVTEMCTKGQIELLARSLEEAAE